MMDEKSGEADLIIAKLRKKKPGYDGGQPDQADQAEGDGEDSGSSGEAFQAAIEDAFTLLRGRAPKESEATELGDAIRRAVQNCPEDE